MKPVGYHVQKHHFILFDLCSELFYRLHVFATVTQEFKAAMIGSLTDDIIIPGAHRLKTTINTTRQV
jgi:hypothetical protein